MTNYVPKSQRKKSKRVVIDNPFLKFLAGLFVFALGVVLAGMIAL